MPARKNAAISTDKGATESLTAKVDPLSVLNAIAAEASRTTDLSELLGLALDQILSLTEMEGGAALLVAEDAPQMTLAAERKLPRKARELLRREPLPVGRGIPGLTAERCQLLIVDESRDDERELPVFREIGVRTHVCIPLAVRGRALGVLGMIDRKRRSFSPADRALFNAIGEQLGIAVERANEMAERRRAEQALRESEERYRSLYNSTPVMMHSIGRDGRLISVNDYWLDVLGYERSEVIGRESTDFMTEASRRYAIEVTLPAFFKTGSAKDVEYQLAKKNGEVIDVLLSAIAERDEAGEMSRTLAFMVDVTEHKRVDAALHVLNKRLEEANRHKSEFLASLSHELRTPLNAILGGSELLGEGLFGPLNEKQAEYVRDIHEGGAHLLSLINDVLDLSKVEAGKIDLRPSPFDLRSLMESSAVIVRERAASKSVTLTVDPPEEHVVVEADERRVKQIVYNLLSNAVKFTPEGGRVALSARCEGEEVVFTVEDTGPGVPEEFCERIFEEFFQTQSDNEGAGLGLALCKRLVELHGGRIWLESEPGQGSRFCFVIPLERAAGSGSGDAGAGE